MKTLLDPEDTKTDISVSFEELAINKGFYINKMTVQRDELLWTNLEGEGKEGFIETVLFVLPPKKSSPGR